MRVLVTHCTRNSGVAVMRALAHSGFEVLGADDRRSPYGLRSRHVKAPYILLPPEHSPEFAAGLVDVLDRVRPDVVIPTRGVEAAVQAREEILARAHALLPKKPAFYVVNDKAALMALCTSLGIAVPRVFEPDEAIGWLRAHAGNRVVIKPRIDVGGGEGVEFVRDASGVVEVQARTIAAYGGAVITEYIPGPPANLLAVQALFDDQSRLIAFFVMQKTRVWPPDVGPTVAALSVHRTELVLRLLPLFEAVGWCGPADVELKIDERDGVAKIYEINPRFSGGIQFAIGCGVDFPGMLCRAATGERLPRMQTATYPAGTRYVAGVDWGRAVLNELREARASRRAIMGRAAEEFRRPRAPTVYKLSDPAPLLAKLWPDFRRRAAQVDGNTKMASAVALEPDRRV